MIPLGNGPLPANADELSARIDAGIRSSLRLAPGSPLSISARLSSVADLDEISVDATGVSVATLPGSVPRQLRAIGQVLVHRLRLVASPLRVVGVPVVIRGELHDVNGNWSESANGDLWITAEERPGERPTTGSVTATVNAADVEQYARQQLESLLGKRGLQLKSFALVISESGANELRAVSNATVGKSFLSAKVTTTGTATFDDQLVVHISDVSLSSPNAMVSALISQWSDPLEEWNGRTINLADYAMAGVRVQSVQVEAGAAIEIRATVGSAETA